MASSSFSSIRPGIRRKGKTKLMAEKLSVVMARRHIRMANVVVLVLDASEGVLGHDATIAGYAHEEGRALILCVNKWDLASEKSKRAFTESIRDELKFLGIRTDCVRFREEGHGREAAFRYG